MKTAYFHTARIGFLFAGLVALAFLLMACSGDKEDNPGQPSGVDASPPAAATPPSSPVTVAMLQAVGDRAFPQYAQSGVYGVCGADGNLSQCPFTDRLKKRLTDEKVTLCRCQNPSQTRAMSAEVADFGGVLYIALFNGSQSFMIPVVNQGGELLLDDQTCMGRGPETSIYVSAAPCS